MCGSKREARGVCEGERERKGLPSPPAAACEGVHKRGNNITTKSSEQDDDDDDNDVDCGSESRVAQCSRGEPDSHEGRRRRRRWRDAGEEGGRR